MFTLDSRLEADTIPVARFALSRVLLMDDATYPWLILAPERANVREITELAPEDRALLIEEIAATSRTLQGLYAPDKINVAALGNMVPQLHVHVIARFVSDPAWPRPVWGVKPACRYEKQALVETRVRLAAALESEGAKPWRA